MNGSDLNQKHSDRIYRIDRILLKGFSCFIHRFGLSAATTPRLNFQMKLRRDKIKNILKDPVDPVQSIF